MMSMAEKLKKSKRYLAVLICAVMLMGNTITVLAAGSLQLKDYFYVRVGMEVVADSVQPTAANDIGGGIIGWEQAVSAGSTVSASLERLSSAPSSTIVTPGVTYTWTLIKAGQTTQVLQGNRISIPWEYAGGYVNVQAYTPGNNIWAESTTMSKVNIS